MANLIALRKKDEAVTMNEVPIHPEAEIEKLIFERRILPDVVFLKRQLQVYSKEDRIDLVGLDSDNNVLVVEIKDETVDESIIPQVLRYAVWVETHPDAIKSIWLEQKDKFGDFQFDWEREFSLRVLVIAPAFKPSVQRLINRITYPVKLVELKKFSDGSSDYIFIDEVVPEKEAGGGPVDSTREYNLEVYMRNRNPNSAKEFWKLSGRLEDYVKQHGWNLSRNNNKGYVAFKYGFPIVFGITFIGSKSFALFFKVPREVAERLEVQGHPLLRYEEGWNQALYRVDDGDIPLEPFEPLFEAAYNNIVRKNK